MKRFTSREKEVMQLLIQGYKNKQISEILCISDHTTKAHIAAIYKKLGVVNRVQATMKFLSLGVLNNQVAKVD